MKQSTKGGLQSIIGGILFVVLVIVGIYYLIFSIKHRHKEPIKREKWCAEVISFDSISHRLDTTYENVVLYDDSLINFTIPNGKVLSSKDFISLDENKVDNYYTDDITLSNGQHFKVTVLTDGNCGTKKEMDDIKNSDPSEDNDN